jgi:hypothetical protein
LYVVLVNCGDWVFGVEQTDPNPLTLGLLHVKTKVYAEHIRQPFQSKFLQEVM